MNISRTLLPLLFTKYTWKRDNLSKVVHLTFDDGPIPDVTEWVLDTLKRYDVKATFFCIADNVRKHPQVFKRIISEEHSVGNHTYNHLNGWNNETDHYLNNVWLAKDEMSKHLILDNTPLLFRPPYGKIKKAQAKSIIDNGYEIIMWSHLTKDYDKNITPEQCYKRAIQNMAPGSIIVFHDSIKASHNLYSALPKTIEYLLANGYTLAAL
ncbi:polysaccharide deacetylase family protein [Myroides marinus]|uniref:polysaccharide deacetylase family protein n=1 Tax=Myroides marinus TaxID=703342 RepID=UPI002576AC60|nr:polysaccharide deacetylase family protein [Myroides marinus]MDM1346987.1 polysaccharide deacetylase family protein [Myroides marinus]MDM1350329.1 polysaccharide deacetylase family protein [Myroides marinus]MDM1354129.1 polysaccharide deacetylase family protein [Myroides marinus]MDM1357536.1 polysaccharide deacetylase family protein [Myroides marinus]MDM1361550.1 polysaccharide deacetylase family protein [Myroides marinus]